MKHGIPRLPVNKMNSQAVIISLLPYLITAQIRVEIMPGSNHRNPGVVVSGSDRAPTNNQDLKAFQLSEKGVEENLAGIELTWIRVGEVNINHASAFGKRDLYITLKPKSGRIIRSNDRIVRSSKVIHNDGQRPGYSKPVWKQEVEETMTTKWYGAEEISVGNNINHIVGLNRLYHTSKYGHEDFATKTATVEAQPEEGVVLQPGESMRAEFQVKETTLEIRVDYEVSLDGDIYFGYLCTKLFIIHCLKHAKLDINDYLGMIGQSPVIKPYEIVTFTYYHDPQVKLVKELN